MKFTVIIICKDDKLSVFTNLHHVLADSRVAAIEKAWDETEHDTDGDINRTDHFSDSEVYVFPGHVAEVPRT